MTQATQTKPDSTAETSPIPIKNLWHMLLYAWGETAFLNRWKAEAEIAPSLDALLAQVLSSAIEQRFRIGLGRGYSNDSKTLRGIRGRVDFAESLKRLAFENGQAHCRFQTYSHNVPKNQIIRSTMARLVKNGRFGADRPKAEKIRGKLRQLVRALEDVDFCEPTLDQIQRQNLGRNDADYRLMLNICAFLLRQWMPTEDEGDYTLPGLDRSKITFYKVFERFVANFYKIQLQGWIVKPQKTLHWHADVSSSYMPVMAADLILHEPKTCNTIVLDTKYTAKSLLPNQWGTSVLNSSHIYQIYAYLRSQEHLSISDRNASGILLYPTAATELDEFVSLQGHQIHFRTVNLSLPWQQIEDRLLLLITLAGQTSPSSHIQTSAS